MKKIVFVFLIVVSLCSTLLINNCTSQWVYQALPSYREVLDIKFFDANTGVMIFNTLYTGMLRTTNGGNNWTLINNDITFYHLEKIDSTALYANGRWHGVERIHRTYDRGLTWDSVSVASYNTYHITSFINRDTGWISGSNYLNYRCIWKTTNGGITLVQLTDTTGRGSLFFLKYKVNGEYIGWHYSAVGDDLFWKTTNSGVNWFQATRPPAQFLGYFEFYNENTGWFTASSTGGGMYKSTNGGMNWSLQVLPSGGNIQSEIYRFKIINFDTLYGGGGYRILPGGILHPLIWKTTNGGLNWGYQETDTSIRGGGSTIEFINSLTGWSYGGNGIHTTNGGGTITFTAIHNNNESISKDFILFQNYPNPFNPSTKIRFSIANGFPIGAFGNDNVVLIVFDVMGREVQTLVNESLKPGTYEVTFDGEALTSGVYFYKFQCGDFVQTNRMVLIK